MTARIHTTPERLPPRSAPRSTARVAVPTPPLWLSWVLAAAVMAATLYGLLTEGAYRETPARAFLGATLRGQDTLTLLCTPVLVWAAHRARAGSLRAHVIWLGLVSYIAYTYLMYVVVPYNDAFLLYVAAIGIAVWLLLVGLLRVDVGRVRAAFAPLPRRGVAWFLVATGSCFALLWLAQNLAAVPGGVPDGLFVYDVPSTVHVLDLALVLPAVIGSGVLLLRGHPAGALLAAVMLVKMATLGAALLSMNIAVALAGGAMGPGETAAWSALLAIAVGLLQRGSRRMGEVPTGWLRPSLW